ncbi:hypothetical protein ACWKSP_08905 [Micromonosporaceae bacterium Da 78-11]
MPIETWALLQAAELAEQAVTHFGAVAAAVQHEAHVFLVDITQGLSGGPLLGVDGGCHASGQQL